MYCRKCKQTFEEGSRRFCPTDGARLVSDAAKGAGARGDGGIFANLIPKIEGLHDLDETSRSTATAVAAPDKRGSAPPAAGTMDEIFFELDDIKPELDLDNDFLKPAAVARKIHRHEIPAGHVDLGDADRS